jgi:hypothetical protein
MKKKMNNAISITTEEHLHHMERATDVGQLDPAINPVKNVTRVNTCLWDYKATYLILKELAKR